MNWKFGVKWLFVLMAIVGAYLAGRNTNLDKLAKAKSRIKALEHRIWEQNEGFYRRYYKLVGQPLLGKLQMRKVKSGFVDFVKGLDEGDVIKIKTKSGEVVVVDPPGPPLGIFEKLCPGFSKHHLMDGYVDRVFLLTPRHFVYIQSNSHFDGRRCVGLFETDELELLRAARSGSVMELILKRSKAVGVDVE